MKAWRGFFLLALCSGMGAAAHGQTLQNGAVLVASEVASEPAVGNLALFPTHMLPSHAPLPDAPVALSPGDDVDMAAESSSSDHIADQGPTLRAAGQTWEPLSGRARLALFWHDSYNSPGAFMALSVTALAGQIEDKPAQWSADGSGYTRHFASAYGQLVASNVIHEGMAAVSGLDPRYVPCQCKGVFRRSRHALKMSFATYTHGGRLTLDVPQLAGAYGSGMISTYWYPHRLYNPLVQGVQFGHEEVGEVLVENLFQEFTSDLKSALHLH
jgi:hypothetical protein